MRRLLPGATFADRSAALLIAALCAAIVVSATGASSWLRSSADEMARRVLASAQYDATQLQVSFSEVRDRELPGTAPAELAAALPPVVRDVYRSPRAVVVSPDLVPKPLPAGSGEPGFVAIAGFPDLGPLIDLVDGRLPRPDTTVLDLPPEAAAEFDGPPRVTVIEVVLEVSAARELAIAVGQYVDLQGARYSSVQQRPLVARMVGTYRAAEPAPTPLDDLDSARSPSISVQPEFNLVRATALAADSRTVLRARWNREPDVRWTFDLARIPAAAEAETLVTEIRKVELQDWPPALDAGDFSAVTGLGGLAGRVVAERTISDGAVGLALLALGAAGLAVLLAAAVVLAGRRRALTAVVRARGASQTWLTAKRGVEALVLTVPGLLLAAGLLVVRGPDPRDLAVAAVASLVCTLLITLAQVVPPGLSEDRLGGVARDALQLVVVALAGATTTLVLLDDALSPDDPVLLLVPPLLGAAAAVLVTRLLQVGLRGVGRLARRTRTVTPVVSLSQAAAVASRVVLPTAAVVLAVSSGLLAVSVGDTLRTGAERTGWEQIGADLTVRTNGIHDDTVARLEAIPGVARVAAVATTESVSLDTRTGVEGIRLIAVDIDDLAAVGDLPVRDLELPTAGTGALAAAASPDLALDREQASLRYAQETIPVDVVDRLPRIPGVTTEGSFLLVDLSTLTEVVGQRLDSYSTVLIQGAPDRDQVEEVARSVDPQAVVTSRTAVTQRQLESPAVGRTLTMLTVIVVGAATLATFAVLLTVGLGGPARQRTSVVLTAVGADPADTRRINMLAMVPIVAGGLAAAVTCGLMLTLVVSHGFDLTGLTSTQATLPVRPTALTATITGALLGGLLLLTGLAARSRTALDQPEGASP